MRTVSPSMDKESNRWLLVLVVTAAASVIFVAYSFLKILSPQPSVVAAPKPTPPPVQQPAPRTEPDWNSAQTAPPAEVAPQATAARLDPFAASYAADAKEAAAHDPVAHEKAVHHQAEYLRDMISQGQLPKGFGNLTKEQVDQMEKKGVLIE